LRYIPGVAIRIHPHAIARMKERGCTRAEVEYTIKHGTRSPAKYGRTRFRHTFAYNRKWLGNVYRRKLVEAFAAADGPDDWIVITVVVKYA
jgi:hypothetical protein